MRLIDNSGLRNAIRQVAADCVRDGETTPGDFTSRFRAEYPELVTGDVGEYLIDAHLWHEGRRAQKTLSGNLAAQLGSRQLLLPMSLQDADIPTVLPVVHNGNRVTVPTMDGTIEDGDAYVAALEQNMLACAARVTDWGSLWSAVRPLLVANPGWRIGDALRFMRDQEGAAA